MSVPPGAQEAPSNVTPISPSLATPSQVMATLPSLRVAKRVVTINLTDVYEGMSFTAWVNYPPEVRELFRKTDEESRLNALRQIVQSTNFKDNAGNDFPPPSGEDFWKAIPDDLAIIMVNEIVAHVGKLAPTNAGK